MSDSVIRFAEGAGPDCRNYRVDCSKLASVLPAAKPRWTVRDGVQQLYEAYSAHGLTLDDLNIRLMRIERIKALQADGSVDADLRWNLDRTATKPMTHERSATEAAVGG